MFTAQKKRVLAILAAIAALSAYWSSCCVTARAQANGKMSLVLGATSASESSESAAGEGAARDTERKMIAFTFDDGPNPTQTARLLNGLAERNAKASFFVLGQKIDASKDTSEVRRNIELVKRMKEEGHVIGNHTYSHCFLSQASKKTVRSELEKTSTLIEQITGDKPLYMRPPGGASMTAPWIRAITSPMITVCWGYFDTRDWQCTNVERMVDIIVKGAQDGEIVLLHDNYATSVDTALKAIDILQSQGYDCVTVDTLLKRNLGDKYELDPQRIYCIMRPNDVSRLKLK